MTFKFLMPNFSHIFLTQFSIADIVAVIIRYFSAALKRLFSDNTVELEVCDRLRHRNK